MGAERGRRLLGVAITLLVAAPSPARALNGYARVQFQDVDQVAQVRDATGTLQNVHVTRQFWSQTYDVAHAMAPRPDLNVTWQLRYNGLSYLDSHLDQQTPYGSLRLVHPIVGFNASYQPGTTTSGVRDARGVENVTTDRRREALLAAYFALPGGPGLDVSWRRQSRDPGGIGLDQANTIRNARVSWDRGPLNVRGGIGDIQARAGGVTINTQRNGDAGASLQLAASPSRSLTAAYDFAATRDERVLTETSLSHNANLSGSLRTSVNTQWTLYYNLRYTRQENQVLNTATNHEGSLLYNLQASRAVRLTAGGGLRTLRTATDNGVLRYVTVVLAGDGDLRRGLHGSAALSHATNWNPEYAAFSVESWHGALNMDLTRRLRLDLDGGVSANGDTAASGARWASQTGAALKAQLLRSFRFTVGSRQYRSGPTLLERTTESSTFNARADLDPVRSFRLTAEVSRTGAQPHNDPRTTTSRMNATWRPSGGLQLDGYYSRSDVTQRSAAANGLIGTEIAGARLLAALNRAWTVNAGVNVGDPRRPTRSHQADIALTWSFGGPA